MVRRAPVPLPSPSVSFPPDFLARLGLFGKGMRAARERREGAGRSHLFGVGTEFVGYRSYRPGDDLRQLDWALYARLRRPYIRLARREASEHWALLLDTSASMGVGVPGKLQRASEVAACVGAAALSFGATLDLWTSGEPRFLPLRRTSDLGAWLTRLERERAAGERGIRSLCAEPRRLRRAGRLFCVGDFQDLEPRHLFSVVGRREVSCVQLFAPEELEPPSAESVEWIDAEVGERFPCTLDPEVRGAYEKALAASLEAWGAACTHHRATYACWSSAQPFERIAHGLFD